MDYKELIELSQKAANEWRGDHTFYQAGVLIDSLCTAIETLLAELDAAVDMLHGECHACKHNTVWHIPWTSFGCPLQKGTCLDQSETAETYFSKCI